MNLFGCLIEHVAGLLARSVALGVELVTIRGELEPSWLVGGSKLCRRQHRPVLYGAQGRHTIGTSRFKDHARAGDVAGVYVRNDPDS